MSDTSTAPAFCSRYSRRLVPGIGTRSSPWASTQASASCAGVMLLLLGDLGDLRRELQVRVEVLAGEARTVAGGSRPASRSSGDLKRPDRKPRPSGEYGTKPIPSSRQVGSTPFSGSRDHSEYSVWTAVIGWTAWARRIVSGAASLRPMWRTLPCLDELGHRPDGLLDLDVGVDPVLVEEVDVIGPEALERAVDRAADVLGRAVELADRRHVAGGGGVHPPGELGRDHVLVAVALDRAPDELLVGQRPVQLRGVEEVDPELERPLDGGDRLALVG